ncbi:MAG: hypothetical protein H6810_09540 [Phycisphaeraceae bacterium]|nr:MAG: hypothetical protein H6810_09540 [Phycisphaeraceae bacterium]
MSTPQRMMEKRIDPRRRRSDALFWRFGPQDTLKMGWLLERSRSGLAFAWRGENAPTQGTLIEVHTDAGKLHETPETWRVKRITSAHDDLVVIAAELRRTRSFPPLVARASADVMVEVTSLRTCAELRGNAARDPSRQSEPSHGTLVGSQSEGQAQSEHTGVRA